MAVILTSADDGALTADGSTSGGNIKNPDNAASIYQMVAASGDFGSGTLAVEMSVDGGTTYFAVTDSSGAVTLTDDGAVRTFLLGPSRNQTAQQVKIRLTLSGATNPDIDYLIADCR